MSVLFTDHVLITRIIIKKHEINFNISKPLTFNLSSLLRDVNFSVCCSVSGVKWAGDVMAHSVMKREALLITKNLYYVMYIIWFGWGISHEYWWQNKGLITWGFWARDELSAWLTRMKVHPRLPIKSLKNGVCDNMKKISVRAARLKLQPGLSYPRWDFHPGWAGWNSPCNRQEISARAENS